MAHSLTWVPVKQILLDRGFATATLQPPTQDYYMCDECGYVIELEKNKPTPTTCLSCAHNLDGLGETDIAEDLWLALNDPSCAVMLDDETSDDIVEPDHISCDCEHIDMSFTTHIYSECIYAFPNTVDEVETAPICPVCLGCFLCRINAFTLPDYDNSSFTN